MRSCSPRAWRSRRSRSSGIRCATCLPTSSGRAPICRRTRRSMPSSQDGDTDAVQRRPARRSSADLIAGAAVGRRVGAGAGRDAGVDRGGQRRHRQRHRVVLRRSKLAAPRVVSPSASQQPVGDELQQLRIAAGQVHVHRAAAGPIERLEVAERLRHLEHPERERLLRHRQIGRGSAVITRNTPVLGPPLWSWPVEWR